MKRGKNKNTLKGGSIIDTSNYITTILLIGIIVFLTYQMLENPTIVVEQKEPTIIYNTVYDDDEEEEPYRDNIYTPDIRRSRRNPPFNYPTRGPPEEYDLVGFLQDSTDPNKLQQLYGRRTYPNSNNWNYFVKSDQYHQIPIPVTIEGRNCTDETGCSELQSDDNIDLLNREHTATIYKPEPFYYNPYVV